MKKYQECDTKYTSRERIIAAFGHREADRVPMWDYAWGTTLERWKKEGMPADADFDAHFEIDAAHVTNTDWTMQFPTEVIEETDEYVISRNANGALSKSFKCQMSTPHWWDFKLTDRASWEEWKHRLTWNENRVDLEKAKAAHEANRDKYQIYMPATCGFELFKYAMGMEEILMAFAEDPEWVKEMCMVTAQTAINGLEYLLGNGFEFDAAEVTEDNGFRGKSFVSPRTYREVVMPCQKLFCDFCHARGIKTIIHTCGYNMELVPIYIEAGFDCLNPLEVKAGMDPLKLKKEYGDVLVLWGGIDVRTIANPDPAVLEKEISEKVPVLKKGGGYIFASDHSIADNISYRQFQRMMELRSKYGHY